MPERLLDHDPPLRHQAGVGQALDHPAEQERRDLEVEHRSLGTLDRVGDPRIGRGIAEVALHIGQSSRKTVEDGGIDRLPGAFDRLAGPLHQLVHRPVVDRDSDDRALQQPTPLEPVQRSKRHHLRQVTRDPEDHEDVRDALIMGCRLAAPCRGWPSNVAVIASPRRHRRLTGKDSARWPAGGAGADLDFHEPTTDVRTASSPIRGDDVPRQAGT